LTKVLVADDERDTRDAIVDILFDAGYDVIEAPDGGAALEKACQEHPDIILLDVSMPVMNGFDVLRKLRESPATEAMPVILLTVLEAAEGEPLAMKLGVNHYITKPQTSESWDPGVVQATVRVALRGAGAMTEEANDASVVWHGSTSYLRTPDGQEYRRFIKTADLLAPLEQKLNGGIPLGSLTLIEGPAQAGKSVVCQHFTYGALVDGHRAAYFTSEHTAGSLAKQMGSIGLGISKYLRDERLSIHPVEEPVPGEDSGPLLSALAVDIDRHLPKKCDFVTVDAITSLVGYSQAQSIVEFFSSCKRLCSKGRTVMVVAHSYAFDASMFTRLSTLCDSHLRLRSGKIREKVVRMLEVVKVDNVELNRDNIISFEVEPGAGIRIIPFSQAKV